MRHLVSTLALAPLLIAQGRHVKRTVPHLAEPDGEREGVCGSGPLLRLLIVGDSAAAGVGAASQDKALTGQLLEQLKNHFQVHWQLIAKTGATTHDTLARLEHLSAQPFDVVVTSLGVNDVTAQRSLTQWRHQQGKLIALLERKFSAQRIFLSGLPPMHRFPALPQPLRWYIGSRAKQFDRALMRLALKRDRCEFVQLTYTAFTTDAMAKDGFHPGPAIYQQWAKTLAQRILKPT